MAVIPRLAASAKHVVARSSQAGGLPARTRVAIAVGVTVPVVVLVAVLLGIFFWRRRKLQPVADCEEADEDFRVLRVRKFVIEQEEARANSPNLSTRATSDHTELRGSFDEVSILSDPPKYEGPESFGLPHSCYSSLPEVVGGPQVVEEKPPSKSRSDEKAPQGEASRPKKWEPIYEQILGIDKRTLLQDLTDPRGTIHVEALDFR